MKARILIEKSFDEEKEFSKELEEGDLKKFFDEEGRYLEDLSKILKRFGEDGDEYVVSYTVVIKKWILH